MPWVWWSGQMWQRLQWIRLGFSGALLCSGSTGPHSREGILDGWDRIRSRWAIPSVMQDTSKASTQVEKKHFNLMRTLNKPLLVSHTHAFYWEVVVHSHLNPGVYLLVNRTRRTGSFWEFLLPAPPLSGLLCLCDETIVWGSGSHAHVEMKVFPSIVRTGVWWCSPVEPLPP